ncbi:MAG: glucokinase [Thermoleophilaceae bacterium]|jgi:glucokinase|nr:glucokinase [Thermoleophilaceae bacterium]
MSPRRVIGIDAGGTKLLGGVIDEGLAVRHRVRRLWRGSERGEVLDVLVDAVEEARAAAPDAVAVGIGIPSLIDWETGVSAFSVHLPLDGVPFRDLMQERLGLAVHVDNDANLAMLAEHRAGAARGCRHAVLLTLGTGIGGGLILDGKLYRGAHGGAGELGHVVVDMDGPPCQGACPNRGCLEAMASGTAIGREGAAAAEREPESALARELREGREITGALVTELAHDGDAAAAGVLGVVGERLGVGIAGIVNTFNPEVVVVGGGAVAGGELLLEPARRVVADRALPPNRDQVRIVAAHFGEEAGMMGAALLALEEGRVR